MALEATTEAPQRMSMDDIAASILVKADPAPVQEDDKRAPDEAEIVETASENDAQDAEIDINVEDSDVPTEDAAEADDENFETFQLTDDTLVSVTVDGQAKEVTLADLKRAYSGEGAIEKRLQIATETKKQAESLKVQVEQELNTGRQNLVKAFAAFESMMFQPQVSQPDPALLRTNPQLHYVQQQAWEAEQRDIQAKRQKVQQAVTLFQQQQAQQEQEARAKAAQRLVELMPVLRDPVKGPEMQKMMVDGAYAYGFNDAELAQISDERMYLVLADAAAYRKLKAKGQAVPQQPSKTAPIMRPGATRAVATATAAARQQKAALETARKTGRVDDIAATMLVRKPKR
jgi:hypothetical protein